MYKHILIPIDVSNDQEERALDVAISLAQLYGATLHVMTVAPDFGMSIVGQFFPEGFEDKAIEAMREALVKRTDMAVPKEVSVQNIVAHGGVYEEILRAAKAVSADLIVIGASRPALKDYLLGPNAARVVRHAPVSVMVVR